MVGLPDFATWPCPLQRGSMHCQEADGECCERGQRLLRLPAACGEPHPAGPHSQALLAHAARPACAPVLQLVRFLLVHDSPSWTPAVACVTRRWKILSRLISGLACRDCGLACVLMALKSAGIHSEDLASLRAACCTTRYPLT